MDSYRHYIRVDANSIIIHGFSDAFEQPQAGDFALTGDFGRHFQIPLLTERGQYKFKLVDGQMVERTQAELNQEWSNRPAQPPTSAERIKALEDTILSLLGL